MTISASNGVYAHYRPRMTTQSGGRPSTGDLDGEGDTECTICGRDFFVLVRVRSDIIVSVEADHTRQGHKQATDGHHK